MVDQVELLPCPFCGSVDVAIDVSESKYPGQCVTCQACCAEGPAYGSEEKAIAAWNTRTPTTPERSDG